MLFRTIVNSTKILFLYPLIQPPSPKIKIPQNSNFSTSNGLTIGQMIEELYQKRQDFELKIGITYGWKGEYHNWDETVIITITNINNELSINPTSSPGASANTQLPWTTSLFHYNIEIISFKWLL